MPRLIIEGQQIEVPPGTKVIEAAERLGIIIPRFCYHHGLGPVGACRMCAVKVLQGPQTGVQMSCMLDAQDGMVVSTTDEEAVDFRRHVIEWLMLNHPHDCPVCDEGGHCLLQDMTVSGGHGRRRYLGKKRTYQDQYLGALLQHEMNRCIHCYRCSRFYQEFCGYRDLGVLQIANKVYFGRFGDGPLENPFSGNLVDLCPTGVYTDKPTRFMVRRWDLERGPSVCIHCSLGCNTVACTRYREVLRQEARLNQAVNGYFICDRGRYGFAYAGHPERPRSPRVGDQPATWEQALLAACDGLSRHPPEAVAVLGSTRCSVETLAVLNRLTTAMHYRRADYFFTDSQKTNVQRAVGRLDRDLAVSLREVESADCIIAVGVDPIAEAPMLTLAMRQAWRKDAAVVVIDPRPVNLPFAFTHFATPLRHLNACLGGLLRAALNRDTAVSLGAAAAEFYDRLPVDYACADADREQSAGLLSHLKKSRRPILICGTDIVFDSTIALAADLATLLRADKERAGLFYVLPGADAFAAARYDSAVAGSFEHTLQAIEEGVVKALLVVESDPFSRFPDGERLEQAVDRLDCIMTMDYLPSRTVEKAHVFLPTRTIFEARSTFINQEGRMQVAEPIHLPGVPIRQVSAKSHPPRLYETGIPGGEPRAAGDVLANLAAILTQTSDTRGDEDPWPIIAKDFALDPERKANRLLAEDIRILPAKASGSDYTAVTTFNQEELPLEQFEVIAVDWTFGTEELASYSEIVQRVEVEPYACMHPADANRLGLSERQHISIRLEKGTVKLPLRLSDKMARGVVILPRHRRLNWQRSTRFPLLIAAAAIVADGPEQHDAIRAT